MPFFCEPINTVAVDNFDVVSHTGNISCRRCRFSRWCCTGNAGGIPCAVWWTVSLLGCFDKLVINLTYRLLLRASASRAKQTLMSPYCFGRADARAISRLCAHSARFQNALFHRVRCVQHDEVQSTTTYRSLVVVSFSIARRLRRKVAAYAFANMRGAWPRLNIKCVVVVKCNCVRIRCTSPSKWHYD